MNVDVFLIKFWGWLLVISGLMFVLSKSAIITLLRLSEEEVFSIVSGYIALLLGLFTLVLLPGCGSPRLIAVKILGLIGLIKGISLIVFGGSVGKAFRPMFSSMLLVRILFVISAAFGVWLLLGVY